MKKEINQFNSLDDIKNQEMREWQERPGHERIDAACDLSIATFQMKDPANARPRLRRFAVRFEASER